MTARTVVLGIDDTDMPGTRGTGRLARQLSESLERAGLGRQLGVTRHQFHVGPGVPFTSHNSGAAIALESDADVVDIERHAREVMTREFIEGSDPGLAVLTSPAPPALVSFARRAQRELVKRDEARLLGAGAGLALLGLGGTCDGIIGALSSAVLRWDGNDGRYVGLAGVRDLVGRTSVAAILETTPVTRVVDETNLVELAPEEMIETGDWVRPRLMWGAPVVVARRGEIEGVWFNADRRTHED